MSWLSNTWTYLDLMTAVCRSPVKIQHETSITKNELVLKAEKKHHSWHKTGIQCKYRIKIEIYQSNRQQIHPQLYKQCTKQAAENKNAAVKWTLAYMCNFQLSKKSLYILCSKWIRSKRSLLNTLCLHILTINNIVLLNVLLNG